MFSDPAVLVALDRCYASSGKRYTSPAGMLNILLTTKHTKLKVMLSMCSQLEIGSDTPKFECLLCPTGLTATALFFVNVDSFGSSVSF